MSNWDKAREYFKPNSKLDENEKDLIKASLKDDFIKKWYLDRNKKVNHKTKLEQWRDKFVTKDSEYGYDDNVQTREVLFEKHNSTIDKEIRRKIDFNKMRIKSIKLMQGYVDNLPQKYRLPSIKSDIINPEIRPEYENPMVEFIDLCDFFS